MSRKKKCCFVSRGRAVLGFHIDTLNTRGCVRFFSLEKHRRKTLVISLACSLSSNKRKSSLVVNNRINKKRFIFTLLRYNAFYRACSHHSLSLSLSLSLLLSFFFSRVSSTESALERLHDDDDDDVENDLSRETSTESWILEEHG